MKKTHVENVIDFLEKNTFITMAIAAKEFNCWCLNQTVTKANKKLATVGKRIVDAKHDGGYAVYVMERTGI